MKAVIWDNDALGANYRDEEIPADLLDKAKEARHYLIENRWFELDDEAMMEYLEGNEPSEEVLKKCIRKAVAQRGLLSDPVRLGLQEQGACRPCSTPSSTTCRRRSMCRRRTASTTRPKPKSPARRRTTSRSPCLPSRS